MVEKAVEYYLYCLLLENNCYYIGISNDVKKRFKKHKKGKGARFTKKNKPVKMLFSHSLGFTEMDNILKMETQATINLMSLVGCAHVRGGQFIFVDDKLQYEHFKSTFRKNKSHFYFPKEWSKYSFEDYLKFTPIEEITFEQLLKIKFGN